MAAFEKEEVAVLEVVVLEVTEEVMAEEVLDRARVRMVDPQPGSKELRVEGLAECLAPEYLPE